jgi:uncharacterized protein YyaL (SSP411 family)
MPNRLINESSPYLLQHAHNPVEWYPWGEEALKTAQREDKLILVSIGYAACHWCHVMERESFEDPDVAAIMNEHFISIKVDREERPDIDQIYMDAITLLTGQGGWPLNCFALPDGRPISGGTYFPRERWNQVLIQLARLYNEDRARVLSTAENLTQHVQNMGQLVKVEDEMATSPNDIRELCEEWVKQIDFRYGGRRSNRNKFPLPMNNLFLLRAGHLLGKRLGAEDEIVEKVGEAVDVTLRRMAFGGIYDQLGGGFARYSVDAYWQVPHFEKMLYDNGQLVSLYAEAYQATPEPKADVRRLYRQVVYQTLDFVERELCSPEGGFYSSLDADSEGVEGKFYTWKYKELQEVLGEKTALFAKYYNAQPHGNWEETNVLFCTETEAAFAEKEGIEIPVFQQQMAEARAQLFEARASRIRPGLDDKILASWNGLMLKGYVDAYRVFGESRFLEMALQNARFLTQRLTEDGARLYRNYKEGKRSINGFLDDYANVADALLSLYQVTFDEQWLHQAEAYLQHVQQHFFDEKTGMYFYTSDEDDPLISRKAEITDDVIPASNSVLAHVMHDLGLLLHRSDFRQQADQLLQNLQAQIKKHPAWHANWALLLLKKAFPHHEIALTGSGILDWRQAFEASYHPNRIFAGAEASSELPILEGRFGEQPTIYVCQDYTCQLPVHSVADALKQMT